MFEAAVVLLVIEYRELPAFQSAPKLGQKTDHCYCVPDSGSTGYRTGSLFHLDNSTK